MKWHVWMVHRIRTKMITSSNENINKWQYVMKAKKKKATTNFFLAQWQQLNWQHAHMIRIKTISISTKKNKNYFVWFSFRTYSLNNLQKKKYYARCSNPWITLTMILPQQFSRFQHLLFRLIYCVINCSIVTNIDEEMEGADGSVLDLYPLRRHQCHRIASFKIWLEGGD